MVDGHDKKERAQPPRPGLTAHARADRKLETKTENDESDVILVHSRHASGNGFNILRQRQQRVEWGKLQQVEQGQPIHGEIVRLSRREGEANLFDAETLYAPPAEAKAAAAPSRKGPAQVATDTYRQQWESIFGCANKSKGAPN
jgi:hypothetical protein